MLWVVCEGDLLYCNSTEAEGAPSWSKASDAGPRLVWVGGGFGFSSFLCDLPRLLCLGNC